MSETYQSKLTNVIDQSKLILDGILFTILQTILIATHVPGSYLRSWSTFNHGLVMSNETVTGHHGTGSQLGLAECPIRESNVE